MFGASSKSVLAQDQQEQQDLGAIESQSRQHYNRGRGYMQEGNYQAAQQEFKKALETAPAGENQPEYLEKIAKQQQAVTEAQKVSTGADSLRYTYTIGVGDVLAISVWQEDNLKGDVSVRPDGMISFPLVGDVSAAGLTLTQLDEDLTQRLSSYIRYPEVTINVKRMGGQKVVVLGEVVWPGVYYVTGKKTVLEAIALANGFNQHAVPSSTILIRGGMANPQGRRLNLSKSIVSKDYSENVSLQEEDIIYVPKKFIANVNYFVTTLITPITGTAVDIGTIRNTKW